MVDPLIDNNNSSEEDNEQPKADSPVIVEEPPVKDFDPTPTQLTATEIATQAGGLTTTDEGTPRLEIAPVSPDKLPEATKDDAVVTPPASNQDMSQASMSMGLESVLPPAFQSVRKTEQKDLEARKAAAESKPDFTSFIRNIQTTGKTQTLKVGNRSLPITKGIADTIKIDEQTGELTGDPTFILNLKTFYNLSGKAAADGRGPIIAYETAAGQFDLEAANKTEELVPPLFRQYNARKEMLKNLQGLPKEIQETVVNNIDFSLKYNVSQRLAEAGRFLGIEAPDFLIMLRGVDPQTAFNPEMNPVIAAIKESGSLPGTAEFKAEYAVQSQKFREKYLDFKGWVRDNIPAATLGRYYDEHIHRILEKQLPPEEYEKYAYERDANGEIITAQNGDKIKASFISEDVAYNINDATFDAMHPAKKAVALILEEVAFTAPFGFIRTAEGLRKVDDILALAKTDKYKHLLQGITEPRQIQEILAKYESRAKADTFWRAGIEQYETNQTLANIDDRLRQIRNTIDNLNTKYPNDSDIASVPSLIGEGTVDLPKADHLRRLNAEAKQLKATKTKLFITGQTLPYVQDVTEASVAIGLMTAGFREYGPFDDPNTNEAFGNLFASLGGYRPIVYGTRNIAAKGAVAGASRMSNKVAMPFTMIRDFIGSIPVAGPILVDKTIENVEQVLGKTLSQDERRHLRTVIEFYKKLKPEDRAEALASQQESFELIDRYASKFSNPDRMRQLILDTYEHTSGIISLIAAGQLNNISRQLDLDMLSKYDIKDMESNFKSQQSHIILAEEAIRQIKEGLSGIENPLDRAIIEEFVESKARGLEVLKNKVNEDNLQRLQNLENLESYVLTFGKNGADIETIESLSKYRATLESTVEGAGELGIVLNKAENVKAMKRSLDARRDRALRKAAALRGKPGYEAALNEAIEELVNSTRADKYLIGDEIYNGVREIAKATGPIDIKDVVMELADGRGTDGLKAFFGPDSALWDSADAVDAEQAFERILNDNISATDMADIRSQLLKKAKDAPGAGKIKDKIRNMSELDIAIELMEKNPDFNPFLVADAYDLELLRRHFKRMKTMKSKAGEDTTAYSKFIRTLDNTIANQSEDLSKAFINARKEYEIRVGVPTTRGMYIDELISKKDRVLAKEIDIDKGSLKSIYKDGFEPRQMFNKLGDGISSILSPVRDAGKVSIKNEIDKLVYSFGEFHSKSGKFVFDTSTEAGAARLEDVRAVVREVLINKMGPDFLKKYKKVKSKTVPEALVGEQSKELMNDIDAIINEINIPVLQADGTILKEALIDPMEILEVSKPLQQVMKEQPRVAQAFSLLKERFKKFKQKEEAAIAAKKARDESSINLMENVLGNTDPKSFFDKYILSGEGGRLQAVKDAVVRIAEAEGRDPKEALKDLNDIMAMYTIQGLFNLAGVQGKKGKVIRPPGKSPELVAMEIEAPQSALEVLSDPNTSKVVRDLLGNETYEFLEDTLRIMNESTHVVRAATQTNDYKGIKTAGIVSRIWNGVKGFVSPVYIATEYLLTTAKAGKINIMKLAVQDREAAIILHKMLKNQVTKKDIEKFDIIATNYLFTELGVQGMEMSLTGEEMPITSAMKETVPQAVEAAVEGAETIIDAGQSALDSAAEIIK